LKLNVPLQECNLFDPAAGSATNVPLPIGCANYRYPRHTGRFGRWTSGYSISSATHT
jgi:hypothetical protein